jgi:hypothetical protein
MRLQETIRRILREQFSNDKTNIDTKVTDENGNPLIMYHGGSYNGDDFRGAAWFTTSKKDASYYAKQIDGFITKAYLIVKNPLYVGDVKHLKIKPSKDILDSVKRRGLNIITEDGVISFIEPNDGVIIAQDINRDGVIDLYKYNIVDVVVFNDSQIIVI